MSQNFLFLKISFVLVFWFVVIRTIIVSVRYLSLEEYVGRLGLFIVTSIPPWGVKFSENSKVVSAENFASFITS